MTQGPQATKPGEEKPCSIQYQVSHTSRYLYLYFYLYLYLYLYLFLYLYLYLYLYLFLYLYLNLHLYLYFYLLYYVYLLSKKIKKEQFVLFILPCSRAVCHLIRFPSPTTTN